MNKNWTGNMMTLEHFNDFYMLEALMAAITMEYSAHPDYEFRHSVVRLEADVKEAFAHLTHEMALRIYVYLWSAALGEARYAQDFNLKYYIKGLHGLSRSSVYDKALSYFPCQENVTILKNVFNQKWGGAYGGEAWLNIVEAMEMYGKVSDATFIDHSVDLEHNGGCVFSKSAKFGLDCDAYSPYYLKKFLDFKFAKNILEDLNDHGGEVTRVRVSRKVYGLIERFINVCVPVGSSRYDRMIVAKHFIQPSLSWLSGYSVEWDTQMLEGRGKETSSEKYTTKHVETSRRTHLQVGHYYKVRFDGRSHGCGWDHYGMDKYNGRVIKLDSIGYDGRHGKSGAWFFSHHWLTEVERPEIERFTFPRNVGQQHVDRIVPGVLYFVHYDDNNISPHYVRERMVQNAYVRFFGTSSHGYGIYKSYVYNKRWVFPVLNETEKVYVTVKRWDGRQKEISWLSGMQSFVGKKCTLVENGKHPLVKFGKDAFYLMPEWILPYERQERVERRREDDSLIECHRCRYTTDTDEAMYSSIDGNAYCQDCYSKLFSTCDKCGCEDYTDNILPTDNHPTYYGLCQSCYDNVGKVCDECEVWFPNSEMSDTEDGYTVCRVCKKDLTCDKCSRVYFYNDEHECGRRND